MTTPRHRRNLYERNITGLQTQLTVLEAKAARLKVPWEQAEAEAAKTRQVLTLLLGSKPEPTQDRPQAAPEGPLGPAAVAEPLLPPVSRTTLLEPSPCPWDHRPHLRSKLPGGDVECVEVTP